MGVVGDVTFIDKCKAILSSSIVLDMDLCVICLRTPDI